jgi:hypothetical protein
MKTRNCFVLGMLALLAISGCATTKVSDRDQLVTGQLPKPNHIWVYDFAASAADIPANSAFVGEGLQNASDQSAEHIATAREIGAQIAGELVAEIQQMGLPAELGTKGSTVQIDDLEIQGYIISLNKGSATERVAIGLGAGSSELKVAVEGFQMTAQGLRKLGSETTDATGNKTPGMGVGLLSMLATHNPAGLIISSGLKAYDEKSGRDKLQGRAKQTAREIAEQLKKRFEEQGWI